MGDRNVFRYQPFPNLDNIEKQVMQENSTRNIKFDFKVP